MIQHRKPPLFHVPLGQCRWCGEATKPRLKKDGTPHGRQLIWHPECVKDYAIAATSTSAYPALVKRDGQRCADCSAKPHYEADEHKCVWLEVDHEVPLWKIAHLPHQERRRYFRLPNLKLRCNTCHKAKTAREATERAGRIAA